MNDDVEVSGCGVRLERMKETAENHLDSQCRAWGSHSGGYEEIYLLGYNAV
jgi:hypothetical protein